MRYLPLIALFTAHLIWGANFVVAKITLQEFPTSTLAFFRFAFASILIAPFFLAQTKKIKINPTDFPKLITVGVLIITLNITFFFEGITRTTALNASTLTLIIPIMSVLLGWWFLKEKVSKINLLGVIFGLFGALVIVGIPDLITGDYSPRVMLGNVLIILASIVWVAGGVLSRQLLEKYPSLIVTSVAFLVGTVTFTPSALNDYIQNPLWPNTITLLGILGLVYMIFLSSISAYFLFEWGLSKSSVIIANLFQYIEPLIAAILSVLILQEELTTSFGIGAVLIIIGVFLGTYKKELHHHHKPHRI